MEGWVNPQPGWVRSGYWTWDLSHEGVLLYQLSYPGWLQYPLSSGWLYWPHMWHKCVPIFHLNITYLAYMPNLMGIFASSTYLVITWEICMTVCCVLAHMCKNVGSIYPSNILLCDIHKQCGSHLFSTICLYRVHALYRALYRQLLHSSFFTYIDNLPMYTNVITLW